MQSPGRGQGGRSPSGSVGDEELVNFVEQLEVGAPTRSRQQEASSGLHEWLNTLLVVILFGYVAFTLDTHSSSEMMSNNEIEHNLKKMNDLYNLQKTSFQSEMAGLNVWATQLKDTMSNEAHQVRSELSAKVEALDSDQTAMQAAAKKKVQELNTMLHKLQMDMSQNGVDVAADLQQMSQMRDQLKQFKSQMNNEVVTKALVELKMQSDHAVQNMNVNLEAHMVGLKLWVRRKIEAQSRLQMSLVEGKINTTSHKLASQLLHQVSDDMKEFRTEVASATALMHRDMSVMKTAFESKVKSARNNMQDQVKNEQVNLNKDLTLVESKMASEVDAATARIDHKMVKVKKGIKETQSVSSAKFQETQNQFKSQQEFMVDHLAGMFALLACMIAVVHVARHLQEFDKPMVQRKILSILWMVPIYAFTSWLSLALTVSGGGDQNGFGGGLATGMEMVRDLYEAYVIYMFFAMMVAIVGDGSDEKVIQLLSSRNDTLQMPFRLCYCSQDTTWEFAERVLYRCKVCVMQFVFVKPTFSIVGTFLVQKYGEENWYNPHTPLLWLCVVLNMSTATAFYGLLKFYHCMEPELAWCSPWPKFLCIKGVVFMTYWQSLALGVFGHIGILQPQYVSAIQNFLICIEMFVAAVFHFFVFPPHEWRSTAEALPIVAGKGNNYTVVGDNLAVHDFVSDLKGLWNSEDKAADEELDTPHTMAVGSPGNYERYDGTADYGEYESVSPRNLGGYGNYGQQVGSPGGKTSLDYGGSYGSTLVGTVHTTIGTLEHEL